MTDPQEPRDAGSSDETPASPERAPASSHEQPAPANGGGAPASPRGASAPTGGAFAPRELWIALLRPDRAAGYVLADPARLAGTMASSRALAAMAVLLLLASLAAPVPYGLVSPVGSLWKVSSLFAGSLLICFPSLHVFAQYLGIRTSLGQNLVLALLISATAGIFTVGFAPIIWFIDFSTRPGAAHEVPPAELSTLLLILSLVLGMVQMGRCLVSRACLYWRLRDRCLPSLVIVWLALLTFITYRMARLLELI